MADCALVAPVFSGEAGINDRHRLFRVGVIYREVPAFQNFQAQRGKIIVRNGLEVPLRPVAIRHITLSVHFVLTETVKGHSETAA